MYTVVGRGHAVCRGCPLFGVSIIGGSTVYTVTSIQAATMNRFIHTKEEFEDP